MRLAEQTVDSAAVLERLAQVTLPQRTTFSFATVVSEPSRGQRRQAYKALEVLGRALAHPDPRRHLAQAMKETPKASMRSDRPAVLAHALEAIVRLPASTRLADELLRRALVMLDDAEAQLFSGGTYPRVLVELPGVGRLFVEVHPARHCGGTNERWMNSRIAQHRVLGSHIDGFAGVLVFTVRGPAAVHVTAGGVRHPFGACHVCQAVA